MDKQNALLLSKWTKEYVDLLDEVKNLFQQIDVTDVDLPNSLFDNDKPISIVFAGQYSAGKSTILKALTGLSTIDTGPGITTQKTHTYNWNNIKVIDTPGIHTTLCPDHDEISYKAIAESDMLVYVVTHELFDNFIGENFRKLILDKEKAEETILVVNKMAAIGNTIENQNIKLQDLEKVTAPYSPAQLRTVFIDAESYIDSLTEINKEIANQLNERSNFNFFIQTLNDFVHEKGFSSKITTPLHELVHIIEDILKKHQTSTGDLDIDMLEEQLLQKRHIMLRTQRSIQTKLTYIVHDYASQIRSKGIELANSIYDYNSEEEAKHAIEEAYNRVDVITTECIDAIIQEINIIADSNKIDIDELYNSKLSCDLNARLQIKYQNGNQLVKEILNNDVFSKLGDVIVKGTINNNNAAKGLKQFSGSFAHDVVKKVAKLTNKKFVPWDAVKVVKKVHTAGKLLGIFGVIFSSGMKIKEGMDASKQREERKNNREELRTCFSSAANELIKYINNITNKIMQEYGAHIEQIDLQINEIRNLRQNKSLTYKKLNEVQNKCKKLIYDIQHSDYKYVNENNTVIIDN